MMKSILTVSLALAVLAACDRQSSIPKEGAVSEVHQRDVDVLEEPSPLLDSAASLYYQRCRVVVDSLLEGCWVDEEGTMYSFKGGELLAYHFHDDTIHVVFGPSTTFTLDSVPHYEGSVQVRDGSVYLNILEDSVAVPSFIVSGISDSTLSLQSSISSGVDIYRRASLLDCQQGGGPGLSYAESHAGHAHRSDREEESVPEERATSPSDEVIRRSRQ